ncbi:mannosyl-3-phosphoglycerate phosphatase [Candidatus Woesearchaeota archaeon]|nr:mannosyl-3-phosphoglycerate phosphatase [Candidatus Woesearchaeota archaeon]|tara:strand:+ start:2738 stop:3574 length:837 start_codon:yes stop_codon:yes gene_type:complete
MQLIIITDMDGCFLDFNTYSYEDSVEALNRAVKEAAVISFCTGKCLAEIKVYNKELKLKFPFIAENGSIICVPHDFFDFDFEYQRETEKYKIIELNVKHDETIKALHNIRKKLDFEFRIFSEMSPEEINEYCGLPIESVKHAKMKEYDDAVRIVDETPEKVNLFKQAVAEEGFSYTKGGKFHILIKGSDKGKAAGILLELYKKKYGSIVSIGLGDSLNDLPMLEEVDSAFLVARPDGSRVDIGNSKAKRVNEIGPKGWSEVVNEALEKVKKESHFVKE